MSPRSLEFMDQARDRAVAAAELLAADHLEAAVSAAYYAMLYAARAALSEDDEHARTHHRGSWHLFRTRYVTTEAFDAALFTLAQHAQAAREGGDYEAVKPSREEAERYVAGADRFIAAVAQMLGA